jgi:chromosome segregation ATPase
MGTFSVSGRPAMCRFLIMLALWGLAHPLQAQTSEAPAPLRQPEIRLPAITSTWKRPGDATRPEISIEDIEQCMGQDLSLQGDINTIKQRQLALASERAAVAKQVDALSQNVSAVEASRKALQDKTDRFQAESSRLSQRASLIEKKKAAHPRTKAEVADVNGLIAEYNADVVAHNKWRITLQRDQDGFNQAVAAYNASVSQVNTGSASFNERNTLFQSLATELVRKSADYVSNCTGPRTLRQ